MVTMVPWAELAITESSFYPLMSASYIPILLASRLTAKLLHPRIYPKLNLDLARWKMYGRSRTQRVQYLRWGLRKLGLLWQWSFPLCILCVTSFPHRLCTLSPKTLYVNQVLLVILNLFVTKSS
jgi:hypothetical protein